MSTEEDLQGEWLSKMNEFAANNPKASLAEFLEKVCAPFVHVNIAGIASV
jgi:hypothetical protein